MCYRWISINEASFLLTWVGNVGMLAHRPNAEIMFRVPVLILSPTSGVEK